MTTCEITTLKLCADRIWRSKRVDFTLTVSVKAEDAAVVERGEGVASLDGGGVRDGVQIDF